MPHLTEGCYHHFHSLRNLQRQANFLPPALSLLESKKRFVLPPDPSNTRTQGAYADIWQQSSQILGPARHPSRSQSSLDFRGTSPCPAHAAAAPACQQIPAALDHKQQVLLLFLGACTALLHAYAPVVH